MLAALATSGDPALAGRRIVVADQLAVKLGVGVGDEISLTPKWVEPRPAGAPVSSSTFRVSAIIHVGIPDYDEWFSYIPFTAMQQVLGDDAFRGPRLRARPRSGAVDDRYRVGAEIRHSSYDIRNGEEYQ